jgi:hypothetical protein
VTWPPRDRCAGTSSTYAPTYKMSWSSARAAGRWPMPNLVVVEADNPSATDDVIRSRPRSSCWRDHPPAGTVCTKEAGRRAYAPTPGSWQRGDGPGAYERPPQTRPSRFAVGSGARPVPPGGHRQRRTRVSAARSVLATTDRSWGGSPRTTSRGCRASADAPHAASHRFGTTSRRLPRLSGVCVPRTEAAVGSCEQAAPNAPGAAWCRLSRTRRRCSVRKPDHVARHLRAKTFIGAHFVVDVSEAATLSEPELDCSRATGRAQVRGARVEQERGAFFVNTCRSCVDAHLRRRSNPHVM